MSAIDDAGDNSDINPFTGQAQDIKATAVDQTIDPYTGVRTTYYSDGTSTFTQPNNITQGAVNVQATQPDLATQIKNLLSGNSSYGTAGQIASLAGIGTLLNSVLGNGTGGYAGYQGGIPRYTATRQQYATPQMQTGIYEPNPQSQTLTSTQRANMISPNQLSAYLKSGNLSDAQIANQMNRYGITPSNLSGVTGVDQAAIQQRYNQAMGPNAQLGHYRPGQGGITYFAPMQYQLGATPPAPTPTPEPVAPVQAAGGGMMGIGSLGGYSDGGRLLKGPGDGVSDSIPASIGNRQPARLADGEFVVPARIVSELGNGSTDAGARKLYEMMDRVKHARSKAKNIAADTKASKYLPA
jgi:hypothetical protein